MKKNGWISYLVYLCAYSFAANSFFLLRYDLFFLALVIPAFLLVNIFAGLYRIQSKNLRLRICFHGAEMLMVFGGVMLISLYYHGLLALYIAQFVPQPNWELFFWSMGLCGAMELILFYNGILSIYLTSIQLGIKLRIIGILCGMIPVVNLVVLIILLQKVYEEVRFESEKDAVNAARAADQVCRTKYPILLVHGFFYRDNKHLNYWGRIPGELERNGAVIYYGNHQSAASIEESAWEMKRRIQELIRETGAEKLNIIAHSKGGLDCRYAIHYLGMGEYVASLTTISTPHRGCLFADYLLTKIPRWFQRLVAGIYNRTMKKLGDPAPSFLAAVYDLRAENCIRLDQEMTVPEGIYCQSVGSRQKHARGGKFPMNLSFHFARHFDGPNDGIVSDRSFRWGENYYLLGSPGRRGVSHCDMIDLNRENIKDFDVREFYVWLVNGLKQRGL